MWLGIRKKRNSKWEFLVLGFGKWMVSEQKETQGKGIPKNTVKKGRKTCSGNDVGPRLTVIQGSCRGIKRGSLLKKLCHSAKLLVLTHTHTHAYTHIPGRKII